MTFDITLTKYVSTYPTHTRSIFQPLSWRNRVGLHKIRDGIPGFRPENSYYIIYNYTLSVSQV